MRILYSHYLTEPNHPAVRMVESIAAQLRTTGDTVHVHASDRNFASVPLSKLTADAATTARQSGQSVLGKVKRRAWFLKRMAQNYRRLTWDRLAIQQFRPDIVLARQDAYCWSVVKAATEAGIPCVTYADAPVAYESRLFNDTGRWHPSGVVERIERWGLQQSEAVITVSHPAARRLEKYNLSIPVTVNPNGIDPDDYPEMSVERRERLRREIGIQNRVVVGFQGSFRAFHGIERLRELIHWTQNRDDVSWLLVGDGPERAQLEASLPGSVDVVSLGRRDPAEMGQWLSLMDIAVAPHAQLDGDFYFCPLKIIEYAASGCATVASNQGDIPVLLANGRAGEIVADDRLESWTGALETLIENDDYRSAFGDCARRHVHETLTWRHTADRVRKVLRGVMDSTSESMAREAAKERSAVPTENSQSAG